MDLVKAQEERKQRILISKRNWAKQLWYCEQCDVKIRIDHKSRHKKSDKHISNLN